MTNRKVSIKLENKVQKYRLQVRQLSLKCHKIKSSRGKIIRQKNNLDYNFFMKI